MCLTEAGREEEQPLRLFLFKSVCDRGASDLSNRHVHVSCLRQLLDHINGLCTYGHMYMSTSNQIIDYLYSTAF